MGWLGATQCLATPSSGATTATSGSLQRTSDWDRQRSGIYCWVFQQPINRLEQAKAMARAKRDKGLAGTPR